MDVNCLTYFFSHRLPMITIDLPIVVSSRNSKAPGFGTRFLVAKHKFAFVVLTAWCGMGRNLEA